ncbi:hypothetical protein C7401_11039 [Paraburkholderia unamae]|uniref:hypothetical protein n=1 Tax=Paraburkholderia unamae TaxID=219649 RepID=UPI000DC5DAD9|nr:hypothetical protein [Paraburkholderia unamae]RAR59910.1 hypothetical protein C7401_11039 [Paraburkholderia unamae]
MASRVSSVSSVFAACIAAAVTALALGGCAEEPAQPLPFKPVPAERILKPGYTQPGEGLVAVDVRRERTRNVIVKLRDAPVYIDGEPVTDLMDGEHVTFYLKPGVHRIGVTTQFDPVVELRFVVDPRYTNRASVTFDKDHRIGIRRVAQ